MTPRRRDRGDARRRRLPGVWRPLAAGSALAIAGAVSGNAASVEVETRDLAAALPDARVLRETLIDLGTPAARPLLGAGWSVDEGSDSASGPAERFVWAVGNRAELDLFASRDGARTLHLRGWSWKPPGGARQRVRITINDKPAGTLTISPDPEDHRVAIPAGVLRRGTNRVVFDHAFHAGPEDTHAARGQRRLAAAWAWLRLDGATAPAPSRPSDGTLDLPARVRVDFHALAGAGSQLSIRKILPLPQAYRAGGLRVEVAADGLGVLAEDRWAIGDHDRSLALPLAAPQIVRVSLEADAAAGGLRLLEPTLTVTGVASAGVGAAPTRHGTAAPGRADPSRAIPPQVSPNVIVYVVDTVRADHLGLYGYPRPTTPRLETFSENAIVFLEARANAAWTRASVATLLTGLSPRTHGVNGRSDRLRDELHTLAESFAARGYRTAGFTTNGNVSAGFGFDQGFETYVHLGEDLERPGIHVPAAELHRRALAWIDQRDPAAPFFLYLHATDPHGPYVPAPEFRRRLAADVEDPNVGLQAFLTQVTQFRILPSEPLRKDLAQLYDAEIAGWDAAFGEFVDALATRGLADDALIALTSDHGEEFLEHGWWEHGKTVYAEQLDVPFVVRLPGGRHGGLRSAVPATHVDLVPTLLRAVGAPVPPGLRGSDLVARAVGEPAGAMPEAGYALLAMDGRHAEAIVDGPFKLIRYGAYQHPLGRRPETELFDLARDPREQRNLGRERPVLRGYMEELLRRSRRSLAPSGPVGQAEVDPEVQEALRALGYVLE